MPPADLTTPRDSRVLVVSRRALQRFSWHASQYEFEDVVGQVDDVSLLAPAPRDHPSARSMTGELLDTARRRAHRQRRTPGWPAPAMATTRVGTQHDLLLAVFHHPQELAYLHRLEGWRESARTKVCVLIELWKPWVERDADYLELLRAFDRVYLFNPAVGQDVAQRLGVALPDYLPMGVDALTMCPVPDAPARVLDVYSYGRRAPVVHEALLRLVREQGLTYLYDTLGNAAFRDHVEHRLLLASMMQRSKYFLTHSINDSPDRRDRTEGEDGTLSTRYFEGVAGGAVLLGSRPQTAAFDDAFPWPDVVLPLSYDDDDPGAVLRSLDAQPERTARIRADNVRGTLERHDWAHRWRSVLADAGLAPSDALTARLERLAELAALVTPESVVAAG